LLQDPPPPVPGDRNGFDIKWLGFAMTMGRKLQNLDSSGWRYCNMVHNRTPPRYAYSHRCACAYSPSLCVLHPRQTQRKSAPLFLQETWPWVLVFLLRSWLVFWV